MKKVFTTGEVAKICKVAPRTVSKWFDSGRLRGYRIPGSPDRRIPREHLIKFLKEHGMPLGELEEEGLYKILLVGVDGQTFLRLKQLLPEAEEFRYQGATNAFEVGIQVQSFHPDTIAIDLAMGRDEALRLAESLSRNPAFAATMLVCIAGEDQSNLSALEHFGFHKVFQKPFDVALLAECIRTHQVEAKE